MSGEPRDLAEAVADLLARMDRMGRPDRYVVLITDTALPAEENRTAYGPMSGREAIAYAETALVGLDAELIPDMRVELIPCDVPHPPARPRSREPKETP
jgi:hypothetical protein